MILTAHEAQTALALPELSPAPEHVLAQPGTATPARDVPVPFAIVRRLRFQTVTGETRLTVDPSRKVSAQAFRSVRLLSKDSAERLERLWEASPPSVPRRSVSRARR